MNFHHSNKKTAILICFCLIFFRSFSQEKPEFLDVKIEPFLQYITTIDQKIILDVRTAEELETPGINSAVAIPHKDNLLQFIDETNTQTPILVYCTHGERSITVCLILIENGFEFVVNLKNGIAKHENEIEAFNQKTLK